MSRRFRRMVAACVLLGGVLAANFARADEIRLKNGDRLTGELVRMDKGLLIFKVDYAEGKMRIRWEDVVCIVSERPLPLEFQDNEFLIGTLTCPQDGMVQINSQMLGPISPASLQQLLAINPATYSGLLTLGGAFNSGNTDTRSLNLATRFQVRTHKHRFTIEAKHNYAEADGETTTRNASGSLKYDFFTGKQLYSYAQSLTEQDALANLNLRNTEGLGLGYQFFDSRQLSLYLEGGGSFFNEDVKVGNDHREAAARWAAGFDWEAFPQRFKFFHRQEGYYSINSDAVVLRSEQGLRVVLGNGFAMTSEVDYRYNSAPEPGKKASDLSLVLGLTYEYAYW